jgi:hypothetical protein
VKAGSPHGELVGWCGYPAPVDPWGQPQMCGEIPFGACVRGGMCRGIGGMCLGWGPTGWGGEFQVPPVRYVVNGHLPTSPLAELSADLIKG